MGAPLSWVLSPFDMTPVVFDNLLAFWYKVFLADLVHFLHQTFLQGPPASFSQPLSLFISFASSSPCPLTVVKARLSL